MLLRESKWCAQAVNPLLEITVSNSKLAHHLVKR